MAQPSGVGGRDSNTQNPTPKVLGRKSLSLGASEEKEHGKYLLRPRGTYAGVQVRRGQVRVRGVCPCACVCVCVCVRAYVCTCVQRAGSGAAEDFGPSRYLRPRCPRLPARLLTCKGRFACFSGSAALTLRMVPVPLPLALL